MLYSSVLNWQYDCTFIDKSLCFPADSSLLSCFIYDVLYQLFASWSLCRDAERMWYGWPPGHSSLRATWVWSCCGHPTSPLRQTAPTMVCSSGWLVMARELRRTTGQTSSSATEGTGVVCLKWWIMEVLRFTHVKEEIRVLWLGKDRVWMRSTSWSYCSNSDSSFRVSGTRRRLHADLHPGATSGSVQTQQNGSTSPKQAVQSVRAVAIWFYYCSVCTLAFLRKGGITVS